MFIDAIMRQTIVLIAQFSATAGIRAPLAHLADEVFLKLSEELESQGVSRKLVADMFGMALRTYQRRVQRLRESVTEQGKTLWQSVLEHLENKRCASRRELLDRFRHDDPEAVAAVLNDLVQSGLASRAGSGAATLFSTTGEEERRVIAREGRVETAEALVWLDLCRHPNATSTQTAARLGLDEEILAAAVASLHDQGRITTHANGRVTAT
jgi:DNA-binding MarR family transcriptional regulator